MDWTYLLLIPAIIISLIAQTKVKSTFTKYSGYMAASGMTAYEAARNILDMYGLYNVTITHVKGTLTDHYAPTQNTLALSDSTYNSRSIAAIGVAAHEAGHALQHAENYSPLTFRNAIITVTNIGSRLSWPLLIIGSLMRSTLLVSAGIALFSLVVIFQLVTLPVEFNASRRAMNILSNTGMLTGEELGMTRKVLSAAAFTYVAALMTSLAQLLRLLIIFSGNRRR